MASPKQAIEEAWNRANTLASETEGWKEEKKDDVAFLTSKNFEGCPVNCFKVVGVVNATPKAAVDLLWGWRKEEWQRFAPDIEDWEIVDEVDENTRVVRQVNKLSWPLSNRDMALASGRVESDGTHALIFRSVEHDKVPVVSKNVRANVLLSGFVFAPEGDSKSTLTRIIHVDPAGNIPSSVVNVTAKATHEVIASFNKLLQ